MRVQKNLIGFTSGYGQIAIIFPMIVAAPRYFSGAIQLGGLMQINSAFGQVQGAMSWFVDSYSSLATWRAVVDRLTSFNDRLQSIAQLHKRDKRTMAHAEGPIAIMNAQLQLPDEQVVLSIDNLKLEQGQHTLIKAPSGTGKSILFRTLAGIWPWWQGHIARPSDMMFLPQMPYLPITTLRGALAYPQAADDYETAQYLEVLKLCRLQQFESLLDQSKHWAQSLSPGEQQRVAIARAILRKPKWLFLDEATSALDIETEQYLYQMLRDNLPDTTLISIAHRDSLQDFHDQLWQINDGVMNSAGSAQAVMTPA